MTRPSLHVQLEELGVGDRMRRRARQFRQAGVRALLGLEDFEDERFKLCWSQSGGEIEIALLVLIQNEGRRKAADEQPSPFQRRLEALTLDELRPSVIPRTPRDHYRLPFLAAAHIMQALVASPRCAFHRVTLLCHYVMLREIYTADSPDWSTGGSRAGYGGESTAFVTAKCLQSLLAFADTHYRTASFFERTIRLDRQLERIQSFAAIKGLEPWQVLERRRLALAWYTNAATQMSRIALDLEGLSDEDFRAPADYLERLPGQLEKKILSVKGQFEEALEAVRTYRQAEESQASSAEETPESRRILRRRFELSESAHRIAQNAIQYAVDQAAGALDAARALATREFLDQLRLSFRGIGDSIHEIVQPAAGFVASVLDRELSAAAAADEAKVPWAPTELVFAAAAFGQVTRWSPDERLERAGQLLAGTINARGLLPTNKPFHSTPKGASLYPSGFEVLYSFAQLLRRTETDINPVLARRLLQLFEENQIEVGDATCAPGGRAIGWHAEHPPLPRKPAVWASALAVRALDQLIEMLDARINRAVLRHFSVKEPEEGGEARASDLRLSNLIYPDYGLSHPGVPQSFRTDHYIALVLELMRAHVLGVSLPLEVLRSYPKQTFSLVLYGPAGTGKTTLIEALARSSGAPLVEVSPSDIASAGEENAERQAREIFQALSMLTGAVILFDEFEPILLRRDARKGEALSVFKLLTPAMLVKLTKLYEAAKEQRTAFCLITNHYEDLDPPAIREGRFDIHVPVLRPDPISRAGAYLRRILEKPGGATLAPADRRVAGLDEEQILRFLHVVGLAGGRPVQQLAKGWFRIRDEQAGPGDLTPLDYVMGDVRIEQVPVLARALAEAAPQPRPASISTGDVAADRDEAAQADLLARTLAAVFARLGMPAAEPAERPTAARESWLERWDDAVREATRSAAAGRDALATPPLPDPGAAQQA